MDMSDEVFVIAMQKDFAKWESYFSLGLFTMKEYTHKFHKFG